MILKEIAIGVRQRKLFLMSRSWVTLDAGRFIPQEAQCLHQMYMICLSEEQFGVKPIQSPLTVSSDYRFKPESQKNEISQKAALWKASTQPPLSKRNQSTVLVFPAEKEMLSHHALWNTTMYMFNLPEIPSREYHAAAVEHWCRSSQLLHLI